MGRTTHTALDRARSTTLAWRRNPTIASEPVSYSRTQRRESDSNTRVLADAAVPARSLGLAREIPPRGETESRTPQLETSAVLASPRRRELRTLSVLGFIPSAITCPPVSPRRVPESNREPVAGAGVAGQWGSPFPRHGHRADEDSDLGPVRPSHGSSSAGPSAHVNCRAFRQMIIYLYD